MRDNTKQPSITEALDERARDLDGNTLSRLHQARNRALAEHSRRSHNGFQTFWLAAGSMAVLALVTVILFPQNQGEHPLPLEANPEALDIATLNIDLEVIEELDFYHWLNLQDLRAASEQEPT